MLLDLDDGVKSSKNRPVLSAETNCSVTCTPQTYSMATAAELDLFITLKFAYLFHFQTWTLNKHGPICQLTSAKFYFFNSLSSFTDLGAPPLLLNAFLPNQEHIGLCDVQRLGSRVQPRVYVLP